MSAPGSVRQARFSLLGPIFSFHSFFFLFHRFRKRRFESFCGGGFAWLGPESCCCSRLSQAVLRGRDAFEASFVGDMSAPGSVRKGFRKGVPCWSQSFPFIFLFNGFRKRRFESFCGGGFAWLGPESCCCSRLSQAVYSKARFRDAFEASFVGDMSAPGSVRQGFRKGVPGWSQSFRFIFLSF